MRAWQGFVVAAALLAVAAPVVLAKTGEPETPPRIVIASTTPFDTLDPHLVLDTSRTAVRLNFYDALYRWQDNPVRVAPWLAQSYTLSEDGKVYRFTLRKDVRFHDGTELKASDVVYSVERILAQKRGIAPMLAGLVNPGSTKAIDASTVEFSLSRPAPLFLALLPEVHIVNSQLLKANEVNNDWGRGWLRRNEAGSGPYMLQSYDPAKGVVARRFSAYWQNGWGAKPAEEVELRTKLDIEAGIEALAKGEVQVLEGPFLPHQRARVAETKSLALAEDDGRRIFVGLIHNGREPMKSLEVRRALQLAFDYDSFIRTTLPKGATRAPLPLPPFYVSPSATAAATGGQRTDLEAANVLLAKVRPQLREITIGAIAGDTHSERAALKMLEALTQLSVPARIVAEPWPQVSARMRDEKQMYDILFLWQGPRYLDPNNWVGEMYDCDMLGAGNSSWYCNKDIDRLIKEARAATDPKVRAATFEKAALKVAEDAAGIFVASARSDLAHARRLKGVRYAPVGEALELRSLSLD
jgi:peptide/nickel transport system substrate-binding protein